MGAPGIGAVRQQQCRIPSRGPDVRFPPFVHSKGKRIRYQPYPELQKTFKSLINRLNCSKNVDTYRSILKEIKAAAADHGLYVASWVSNKTRNKIEGIILLEKRKSKPRLRLPTMATLNKMLINSTLNVDHIELLESISSIIDAREKGDHRRAVILKATTLSIMPPPTDAVDRILINFLGQI